MSDEPNIIEDFGAFLIKLFFPIIAGFFVFVIVISILVSSISAFAKAKQDEALAQIIGQSTKLDFGVDNLEQEFLIVDGIKYGLPIKKNLTKVQKLMLLGIRVPEFGGRGENDLAGDLDSFCPYQQRVSELWSGNHIEKKAREVLGENYDKIFHSSRVNFVNNYKNTQLRNYSKIVTQKYGVAHSFTDKHYGIDYDYQTGEAVTTPLSGIVTEVTPNLGGGNVIVIKHEKQGIRTLYAHLSEFLVKVGDLVSSGQIIGLSGNTGQFTTGPHLHFQVMKTIDGDWNSNSKDPNTEPYLLDSQRNQFNALILQLINIHLKTGLCDELALERLKNEPSTKNWVEKTSIDKNELTNLAYALCYSQRPVDCNVWVARSLRVLEKAI